MVALINHLLTCLLTRYAVLASWRSARCAYRRWSITSVTPIITITQWPLRWLRGI